MEALSDGERSEPYLTGIIACGGLRLWGGGLSAGNQATWVEGLRGFAFGSSRKENGKGISSHLDEMPLVTVWLGITAF
jgi:hypothetical protein